jgi:hypothetical protein
MVMLQDNVIINESCIKLLSSYIYMLQNYLANTVINLLISSKNILLEILYNILIQTIFFIQT